MNITRVSWIRMLLLSFLAIGILASAASRSTSSAVGTGQDSQASSADRHQNLDCSIDSGSMKDLEDCPAEVIIAQYKQEGVNLVRRGGAYWEVITGEYVNERYEYKVLLPEGVEALCSPPPAPWHGFFIDVANELPPEPDDCQGGGSFSYYNWDVGISVSGSYNAAEIASVDELVGSILDSYREHVSDAIIEETHTRLRGIPAIHYVVYFSDPKSGEPMVSDNIAAIGRGNVYEIGLTTAASRYPEDKTVLRKVTKSWRLLPIEE